MFDSVLNRPLKTSHWSLAISVTQQVFTCSKLTTETLEQGVNYVQN